MPLDKSPKILNTKYEAVICFDIKALENTKETEIDRLLTVSHLVIAKSKSADSIYALHL